MSNDDQKFLEEALPQLQEYLLSGELYWSLGGSLPRLTPGNLLLAIKRLEAHNPAAAWRWQGKLEAIQTKWQNAWEKKAARETTSRLRLWAQFLEEQVKDQPASRAHYATSVRERVILQLLQPNAPQLAELDARLRSHFRAGEFVWDALYQSVFPESTFWFLYGSL
ncbi:MAG: hypothetical protein DDG60_02370 [Anaerolineae bacterium]|nr:MAG: hypothetical protein DDG60_02370 [Anaerolineae bacterium]